MSEPTVWAKAKAEIQRRGWFQGDFGEVVGDKACRVCVAGAVHAVLAGDPFHAPDEDQDVYLVRLVSAIEAKGWSDVGAPMPYGYVGSWNDAAERTVEDVYALLDELDAAERESTDA